MRRASPRARMGFNPRLHGCDEETNLVFGIDSALEPALHHGHVLAEGDGDGRSARQRTKTSILLSGKELRKISLYLSVEYSLLGVSMIMIDPSIFLPTASRTSLETRCRHSP